jgi:hypothetical protein
MWQQSALVIRLVLIAMTTVAAAAVARAGDWRPYPGNIDMGGWRIVRNDQGQVALLGPPDHHVVVGPDAGQMTGYLFTPKFIVTRHSSAAGGGAEHYYVVERAWPNPNSQLGDQRIVKLSGPLTRSELEAASDWEDAVGMLPYMTAPQAPAESIFWKKPFVVIFYSLVVLGGPILAVLVPVVIVIAFAVRRARRKREQTGA